MRRTAKILGMGLVLLGAVAGAELQGVIADWRCTETMTRDGREKVLLHDRSCSLLKKYNRGAYGLITIDKKFYRLDDEGKKHVLELLKNTRDRDNLKVIVRGDVQGNTIKVSDISML